MSAHEHDHVDPRALVRELRPTLYHRLHALLPFVAHPLARRCWRALGWTLLAAYFAFAGLVLTLRYSVLPNIEHYRGDLEQLASRALDLPVRIDGIEAGWAGLKPDLTLSGVTVSDAAGRPALTFSRVEAILDWSSLWRLQLRLALLAIDEPVLHIRRDATGALSVAGLPVSEGESEFPAWVLAQKRIRINGATLVWEDALRGAPPLILEDVNLALDNRGRHHRFGLTALPPPELAARIDLRGNLDGDDLGALDEWAGQLYTELAYVDLAGWRRWVDYPVALPQGRGGLRAWLSIGEGRLLDLTADLALRDVRLRLARPLPEMHLDALSGRLGGRLRQGGFAAFGKGLTLALEDGTQLPPTDFSADWQAAAEGGGQGSATASRLDLPLLVRLSAYLPLDAGSRKLLADYAPSGSISDLRLSFAGGAERLQRYALRANFADLGLRAQGYFPGFFGISGSLDASERGGSVSIRAQKSGLDLPSVFPEPRLAFDTLSAGVRWKVDGETIDVDLDQVEFAGDHAAGSAGGRYRYHGTGAGEIDLVATLSRARGDAVWRYMPHVVDVEARDWLRRGITAGSASDAKLTLKGDLDRFPFVDGSGTFLVTAKAHDVTIDYAPGWPKLEHVDGDLRFAGAGMRVDAKRGALFGTRIAATVAEIPDFDAAHPQLRVRGRVEGPTADFLRFIEASPVGETLDHATSDMRAQGQGRLDLALDIPLSNAEETRVKGDFRFIDNQVTVEPLLPPLTNVNGNLQFTDGSISVRNIDGLFLGGPVKVRAETTRDGRVDVVASGSLSAMQARRQYDLPLFDSLSGGADWRADIRVKKSSAEIVVESTLEGLSSALPAPFNKTAGDALPLRFEKGLVVGVRRDEPLDRIQLSLGRVARGELLRRRGNDGSWLPLRGALAVGAPLVLPDKGLAVVVAVPQVDADFWRAALSPAGNGNGNGKNGTGQGPAAYLPDRVELRSEQLDAFGRQFHDVRLVATSAAGRIWQASVASREASGEVQFDTFGRGALRARLKTFAAEAPPPGELPERPATTLEDLPALDVIADSFSVGGKKLGRLELQARNEATNWRIEKLSISNPDGRLDGNAVWRMQSPQRFDLDFKLVSEDAGGLLERLGYADTLKRGSATLAGKLSWAGVPIRIDYPTLAGEMRVEAARGQFAKIDPGAAGKLLGLISLQSLPRRISLDFRDVFSEGFAFDSIAGRMEVKGGVMRTDRLQIDGPAARVLMRGEVDLQHETQKLVVNVQPELGGTAALGVALVNPVAGAAALLAHKVLQNPLNQIFSFDYSVTGKWDDPKVEKLSTQRLEPQTAGDGQ
ncbi:YhdP family protein [Azospira restricta]|uniref:TIGR02099 family protein n=1 Tax=Azospira restricta TaxID=404405 RepID=A0A974SS02_9RHOO|nr:YhdP family protein [Azospira restricta]QRJ65248.1 TIGR02099 family protein [Azospira restricta]